MSLQKSIYKSKFHCTPVINKLHCINNQVVTMVTLIIKLLPWLHCSVVLDCTVIVAMEEADNGTATHQSKK